jgi:Rrf2 family protein
VRVSSRLDYALRALIALAERPPGSRIAAGDVADAMGLPRRFVEQQLTVLAHASLVDCRRGAGGGCVLARPADEITVGQVVRAIEGYVLDVPHATGSAVSEMWERAGDSFEGSLDTVTLAELAVRQRELDAERAPVYYI